MATESAMVLSDAIPVQEIAASVSKYVEISVVLVMKRVTIVTTIVEHVDQPVAMVPVMVLKTAVVVKQIAA